GDNQDPQAPKQPPTLGGVRTGEERGQKSWFMTVLPFLGHPVTDSHAGNDIRGEGGDQRKYAEHTHGASITLCLVVRYRCSFRDPRVSSVGVRKGGRLESNYARGLNQRGEA